MKVPDSIKKIGCLIGSFGWLIGSINAVGYLAHYNENPSVFFVLFPILLSVKPVGNMLKELGVSFSKKKKAE